MENATEITFELNNGTKIIKNLNYNFEIKVFYRFSLFALRNIFYFIWYILKYCEKDKYDLVIMYNRFSEEMIILNPEDIFKVNYT